MNPGMLGIGCIFLGTIIHLWIKWNQKMRFYTEESKRQGCKLAFQNEQLGKLTKLISLAASVAKLGRWELDLRTDTLTWDAAMLEMYGIPAINFITREKWASAVCPEDLREFEAMLLGALHERSRGAAEFRIVLPGAGVRNMATVHTAVFDEFANVIQLIGVSMDITERKLLDAAFHQSNDRFRILVESVHDYAIFTLDPLGRVVSWNTGAERIKGYKAREIVGQNFSRFYSQKDIDR
jgi:PAS domain-containing protein